MFKTGSYTTYAIYEYAYIIKRYGSATLKSLG